MRRHGGRAATTAPVERALPTLTLKASSLAACAAPGSEAADRTSGWMRRRARRRRAVVVGIGKGWGGGLPPPRPQEMCAGERGRTGDLSQLRTPPRASAFPDFRPCAPAHAATHSTLCLLASLSLYSPLGVSSPLARSALAYRAVKKSPVCQPTDRS